MSEIVPPQIFLAWLLSLGMFIVLQKLNNKTGRKGKFYIVYSVLGVIFGVLFCFLTGSIALTFLISLAPPFA
jgi:hypothetical protein